MDGKIAGVALLLLLPVLAGWPAGGFHLSRVAARGPGTPASPRVITVAVGVKGVGRFEPAEIHAHPGDLIRFVASFGVHNIDFPPESNPDKENLPPVSDYLLRKGDTYELTVRLAPGTYHFQCDPHAAMGMKGELIVTAPE